MATLQIFRPLLSTDASSWYQYPFGINKFLVFFSQHEAGHFLVAYLMGFMPKSYTLSSLDAFQRFGALNVQAGTTFIDFEFQEEVYGAMTDVLCLDYTSYTDFVL